VTSKLINRYTIRKINMMLVRSVVTYTCETRALSVRDINNLLVFERHILRKIFGPIHCKEGWSIRSNKDLWKLIKGEDIVKCIKTQRMHGSFQKFCTLYVFSLTMNLFYKIHLQAFNVISNVLHHSAPTFGQVLYSCLDAFVVDASDYLGHLIRQLLNASEAFPTEWFLQFWEQVKVWWAEPTRL
jgi:hypothetical protein